MKHGDIVMTQRELIAENGEEVAVSSVGQIQDFGGSLKLAIKNKGDTVIISDFTPSDVVEVW